LVSVVIPAYNAEAYIHAALESALSQTYRRLEVIVVDDGSQDQTAAIVRAVKAQDERVQLVQQPNCGVAAARNLGIERANGEFVAPLDADDIWYPEKIERQVQRMKRGGGSVGMVYSWWLGIDESDAVRLVTTPLAVEGDLYETLLFINFIAASAPLFRRSALERVGGYDPQLRAHGGQGCEDWDLSLRVADHYCIGVAPGYLVGYRAVPGSMSFDCETMARSYDLVIEKVKREHPEIPPELFRWSRGGFAGYLANMSYVGGNFRQAFRWSLESVRTNPALLLGRWTTQLAVRSLLRAIAKPLTRRFGTLGNVFGASSEEGMRKEPISREEAERNVEPVSVPWRSWKPYDRIHAQRWRLIRERATEEHEHVAQGDLSNRRASQRVTLV
jgi:glycosyltransferase involved in cell wall biosynthesis